MAYKEKKDTIKYNNEFNKKAYDRINLTIPKGQKEAIQAAAQAVNESVNAYIYAAIMHRMEREQIAPAGADFHIAPERREDLSE